jgi:membrane protein
MQAVRNARGTAGVIAFMGLPITDGSGSTRCAPRSARSGGLPEYPGHFHVRLLIDLLVLVGLGL